MDQRRDLEWHFNPRRSVPDFEQFFAGRRATSQQILNSGLELRREAYASHARAYYLAAPIPGRPNAPALVYLHGGYWRSGAPEDNAVLIPRLQAMGVAPILLGYPLCPEVRLGEIVDHVCRGLEHIRDNAQRLGIDANRILIAGTSAGAHLAAMALVRDHGRLLKAAMLFSGIYDLTPVPLLRVNEEIGVRAAEVCPMSPALIPSPRNMRISLCVGGNEPALWKAQTVAFENLCRAGGCATRLHVAPGRHHFNLYEEVLNPSSPIAADLSRMVEEAK
jgi:arylformamidase